MVQDCRIATAMGRGRQYPPWAWGERISLLPGGSQFYIQKRAVFGGSSPGCGSRHPACLRWQQQYERALEAMGSSPGSQPRIITPRGPHRHPALATFSFRVWGFNRRVIARLWPAETPRGSSAWLLTHHRESSAVFSSSRPFRPGRPPTGPMVHRFRPVGCLAPVHVVA